MTPGSATRRVRRRGGIVRPILGTTRPVSILRALAALALLPAVLGACTPSGTSKPEVAATNQGPGGIELRTTKPPWPPPRQDARRYVEAAGLRILKEATQTVHYHAHLDLIVDGKPVPVAAGIGALRSAGKPTTYAPVHTHDPSGVLHVESAKNSLFTVGQLFTEWNVRLTQTCLGGLCAGGGKALEFYVDGKPYDGDPAQIGLKRDLEIALIYGAQNSLPTPPGPYDFGSVSTAN